jgi:outer membrane protein OmpA-like peptidoglycan-associated protein
MRNTPIVILLAALLATTSALATNASKEENVGVGSGAVIGAIAGGPVGLILGAALGGKLGDSMHQKNESIAALTGSLEDSRDHVAKLNTDLDSIGTELQRLQQIARPEAVGLLRAGIAMDLLFRTDEYALADTTGARLAELAGMLSTMPDIRIQLDGFADERGGEDYNLVLSQKRVEFVREQLVAAGINPSRIAIAAHGESPAQDAAPDSLALERRVNMTVFIDGSQSFASNPD